MSRRPVPKEQRQFAKKLRKEQTALERGIWHELRARRLDGWKFRRQVPIQGYVADFVCLEARLVVEMDGPMHRVAEQKLRDARRDDVLRRNGFAVLRFSDGTALATVLEEIRRCLQGPLSRPSPDGSGHPLPQGERAGH